MVNVLEQLKKVTTVVADTGDFQSKYFTVEYISSFTSDLPKNSK